MFSLVNADDDVMLSDVISGVEGESVTAGVDGAELNGDTAAEMIFSLILRNMV